MRATLCALAAAFLLSAQAATTHLPATADPYPTLTYFESPYYNVVEIRLRLLMMNNPVAPVFNDEVEAYLRRYLTYGASDAEAILGRATALNPIIEHYLALHGLPDELKFLPIIESEFVPYAESVKGAAGLWQFIPSTAQAMGLVVDQYLDERKDPYKSTEAAVRYLKRLYQRFGTWELALAAYNCGPTRVSRALQNSVCNDYWQMRHQLPRETQRYVSRYLAASYLGTYYAHHGLTPVPPSSMEQEAMAARIYQAVRLSDVAALTGMDLAAIKRMNPFIKRDFVPAKPGGIFLVLPKSAWYDFLDAQQQGGVIRP